MIIGNEIERFPLVLPFDRRTHHAKVISDMRFAGRLDSRENSFHGKGWGAHIPGGEGGVSRSVRSGGPPLNLNLNPNLNLPPIFIPLRPHPKAYRLLFPPSCSPLSAVPLPLRKSPMWNPTWGSRCRRAFWRSFGNTMEAS